MPCTARPCSTSGFADCNGVGHAALACHVRILAHPSMCQQVDARHLFVWDCGCCPSRCTWVQAAKECYEPQPNTDPPARFDIQKLHRRTRRALADAGPAGAHRSAAAWSEEEAYLRTGVQSFVQPYEANEHGGAWRGMPIFAADAKKGRKEGNCTKHQHAHGALSPGLMVRPQQA